jgi:hypothetical protein
VFGIKSRRGGRALPASRRPWRSIATVAAAIAMTIVFGAWGPVACGPTGPSPGEVFEPCTPTGTDACASSNTIRRKSHPLMNDLTWKWAEGTFVAFDVADHRAWFDWSYNLSTQNIRTIYQRNGQGRCLTPIGSCSIVYGIWTLERCDRTGPDTCLFRRESDAAVSFTYGVAFSRHLISCLGTRINWDGSHARNTWGSSCSNGAASSDLSTAVLDKELTIGHGKNEVKVGRYLTREDLRALDKACIVRRLATNEDCKDTALDLFRKLPPKVQKQLKALKEA